MMMLPLLALGIATSGAAAFAPSSIAFASRRACVLQSSTEKGDDWAIIKPSDVDEVWDLTLGGVGLTMDSVVKISGDIDVETNEAEPNEMERYSSPKELNEEDVMGAMEKADVSLICSGLGKEVYKDPGLMTTKEITYSPTDAVRDALSSVPKASASNAKKVVLNFLGGDDLMWAEVVDACKVMMEGLDVSGSAEVTFNSACHKHFPNEYCSVTVISSGGVDDVDEELSGFEKSIAGGEIYLYQGKWYTVTDEDIVAP